MRRSLEVTAERLEQPGKDLCMTASIILGHMAGFHQRHPHQKKLKDGRIQYLSKGWWTKARIARSTWFHWFHQYDSERLNVYSFNLICMFLLHRKNLKGV